VRDNWDCYATRVINYDWNADQFSVVDQHDTFDMSSGCLFRFAEEALWAGDFISAIRYYHTYFDLNPIFPRDYPRFRLGIALVLQGDVQAGMDIISALQTENTANTHLSGLYDSIVEAHDAQSGALGVYMAAYRHFAQDQFSAWRNESIEIGLTIDDILYEEGMHGPAAPSPDRAGCDVDVLIDEMLADTIFATDLTPQEQMSTLRFVISDTYYDDLNGDGVDDWLIWFSALGLHPMLFLSQGDRFIVSRPAIYAPTAENALLRVSFEGDDRAGLLSVIYAREELQILPFGANSAGGPGSCVLDTALIIYRLENHTLNQIFHTHLCEVRDPLDLVNALHPLRTITGWTWQEDVFDFVPFSYEWDLDTLSFELLTE